SSFISSNKMHILQPIQKKNQLFDLLERKVRIVRIRAKVWDYVDSELAHYFLSAEISFRKLHFVLKSHVSLTADLCNERYARCIGCSSHVLNIMVQAGLKSNIMNLFMVFYKSL
ncbi:hypothetical protein ACJX0J_019779, partial [Zea mays]